MFRRNVVLALACVAAPAVVGVGHAATKAVVATPEQVLLVGAMEKLKFAADETPQAPGATQRFEVTDETLAYLKGKVVSVSATGKLTIRKKPAK